MSSAASAADSSCAAPSSVVPAAVSGAVCVAPADCTPRAARICSPKAGLAEWTTMTPIFSYAMTTVPPALAMAFFTDSTVRWSALVLTT